MTNEENEVEEDDLSIPPVVRTVLERDDNPDRTGLGRSVLSAIVRIEEAGWPISQLSTTLVRVSDEFRREDSKRKPGQEAPEHRKGDLVKAAHEERLWWVLGVYPDLRLGFEAKWVEGATPKGARSFKFASAHCADPIGIPKELFVDYSLGKAALKQMKEEPDWAHLERITRLQQAALGRDIAYNLGQSYRDKRPMFKKAGEFETWLDEAIEMTTRITERKEIMA